MRLIVDCVRGESALLAQLYAFGEFILLPLHFMRILLTI